MFRMPPKSSEADQAPMKIKDKTDEEGSTRVKKLLTENLNTSDEERTKSRVEKKGEDKQNISSQSDEFEMRKKKLFSDLKVKIESLKTMNKSIDSDCNYNKNVIGVLIFIHFQYGLAFKEAPLEIKEQYRLKVAKFLMNTEVMALCCNLFIQSYPDHFKKFNVSFCHSQSLILNFSDSSVEFAQGIANFPGYLETMKKVLADFSKLPLDENLHAELTNIIAILHNIGMSDNVTRLEELDFTPILKEFLTTSDDTLNLVTLSVLASIVNEEEAEIINANKDIISLLLRVFERGLHESDRRYDGWSCKECASKLTNIIAILHNIGMSDNVTRLEELDFTPILKEFLTTSDDTLNLVTLSVLASIVNEEEAEIINANKDIISLLLRVFERGLHESDRRYDGWSCKECASILRKLATNDANKKLLVELGALRLLVRLAKTGNCSEKIESTGAIWVLCFDTENRAKIVCDEKLVALLKELSQSEDKQVKENCIGALWTLGVEPSQGEKEGDTAKHTALGGKKIRGKQRTKQESSESSSSGHVMISYQWADQATLIKVRDHLRAHNLQVWIDIEQMGGSTLEAMAASVEQAKVVLVCMSHKYKNSPNCRAEAEYAFQCNKTIIPLKMERGYIPDGWLGIILGTKLFYEFSSKYPFEDKMKQLLKEVVQIYSGNSERTKIVPERVQQVSAINIGQDDVDSAVTGPVHHLPVSMAAPYGLSREMAEIVRHWDNDKVQKWLTKSGITSCNLNNITGEEIAVLLYMRCEAPDFFYKTLKRRLGLTNLLTMSKFVLALTDLTKN